MSSRKLAPALALLLLLAPAALAQPKIGTPVEGCTTECTPKEANPGDVPRTGSQSVKTVLYAHFLDDQQDAPLNAQPVDRCEPHLQIGRSSPIISTYTGNDADPHFEFNWRTMYSSAGLVEFGSDCSAREHQEPGLAIPLKVKGDTIMLYWYVSANPVPGQGSDQTPGDTLTVTAMPNIAVYAHVETGRNPFAGEILAQGDTGAEDNGNLPTSPHRVTIINVPGEPEVYEFQVPLRVLKKEWPGFFENGGGAGFTVMVNTYQFKVKEGPGEKTQVMQPDWRIRTGPTWRPRLVIDTENPMVTKAASLTVFNQAMFVRWSLVSPYGSYDVDDLSIKAHLMGPKEVDLQRVGLHEPRVIKRSLDHDGHFLPINVTWKFDYRKGELPDGDYMIHLYARNFQGTYELAHTLNFTMQAGEPIDVPIIGRLSDSGGEETIARTTPADAPNLGAAAATFALAGAMVLLRRRL